MATLNPQMRKPRPVNLHVKLTADERQRLRELSEADGLDASGFVRQLVNRAHATRFGTARQPTASEATT
jgi:hypothetical protein